MPEIVVDVPEPPPVPNPAPSPAPEILDLAERAGQAMAAAQAATATVADLETRLAELQRQQAALQAELGTRATVDVLDALESRLAELEAVNGAGPGVEPVVPDVPLEELEEEVVEEPLAPKRERGAVHRILFGA